MSVAYLDDYLDDDQISYPGHPNADQLSALDGIADEDPGAFVLGWHYPTGGPMVVRSDDRWQAIQPTGAIRNLVHGV